MRTRRVAAGVLPAGIAILLTAGCANALRDRTMTVIFKDNASHADLVSASKACAHAAPGISALPVAKPPEASSLGAGGNSAGQAATGGTIQFRIGGINDHDLAMLTNCLNKQAGVLAVQPPNDDMS